MGSLACTPECATQNCGRCGFGVGDDIDFAKMPASERDMAFDEVDARAANDAGRSGSEPSSSPAKAASPSRAGGGAELQDTFPPQPDTFPPKSPKSPKTVLSTDNIQSKEMYQAPAGRVSVAMPIAEQIKREAEEASKGVEAEPVYPSQDSSAQNFTASASMQNKDVAYRPVLVDDKGERRRQTEKVSPFPKRPRMCKLSAKAWDTMRSLFEKMDQDGLNSVTKDKALTFFNNFKQINVDALFNEVDVDNSGSITAEEFIDFWLQVKASGYTEAQIMEELEQIGEGGTWVDWKDGRDTGGVVKSYQFPKRPILCRLSGKVWKKIQELFMTMSTGNPAISRAQANAFFSQAFGNVSVEAMFKEVDTKDAGVINAKDWISFWIQVKAAGYKEDQILEEIEQLMEGGTWVDWNDDRTT